ncbi:MAG: PhnD/SsuA/transferrin family substrate-binding protein [Alphaproteobacteria bacterium]|nr:PhnD/SsuA/transferrin family substrate-binding protein [Alphaproteobacteria bacterium]
MMVLASLPMYDLEPLRDATDAWWRALAQAFRERGLENVPVRLDRADRHDHWSSRDLLLSQTCGWPLVNAFAGRLRLLATPRYDVPCCQGSDYCSLILVRHTSRVAELDDLRGLRAAINGADSHSGYNALRATIAPLASAGTFFGDVRVSGSHQGSLAMVAQGTADVCAVDCVSFALMQDTMPDATDGVRVLATTRCAPALPYVTAAQRGDDEVEALREGLMAAASDPRLDDVRRRLRLKGFAILPLEAYDRINAFVAMARDCGYPEVA